MDGQLGKRDRLAHGRRGHDGGIGGAGSGCCATGTRNRRAGHHRLVAVFSRDLRRRPLPFVLLVVVALVLGACASGAASTPAPTLGPRPIESAQDAADAVKQANPLLATVEQRDPDLIGQAHTWEAVETATGWDVTFEVGWGDCFAGCISRHVWRYAVSRAGEVELLEEGGDPLDEAVLQELSGAVPPGTVTTGVRGLVTAGPVCPVEGVPPDPACAPRPVAGAVLIVRGEDGTEAGRAETDERGFFELVLDPGSYILEPQPVEGLMGTAAPAPFTVEDGVSTPLAVEYDTGIR